MKFIATAAVTFATSAALSPAAPAQEYPTRAIRYVVPFAPGGTTDILGRIVGQKLHDAWGQTVVIDNRPGAGGALGAEITAKSAADGYTIMGGTISTHAINASVYSKLPYDPVKDFEAITLLATQPNMLVIHPAIAAKNVSELVAVLKAAPGKYTYATSGNGTSAHLSGELFKSMTKTQMQHVPYKGSPQALGDVIGGQVSMSFDNISTAYVQAKAGKLRAIAVTTSKRSNVAPEVPTFAESGLAGYELGSWHGVFAPAHTPKAIVTKLNAQTVRGIQSADARSRLQALGVDAVGNSSAEFAAFVRAEVPKWAKVVKESGAKIE